MEYTFDKMSINGVYQAMVVNGRARSCMVEVIFWMGTPPSEKDLQPRSKLDVNWDRFYTKCPRKLLFDSFDYEIVTKEWAVITGTGCIPPTFNTMGVPYDRTTTDGGFMISPEFSIKEEQG